MEWFKFEWLVRQSRLYMPSVNDFPDKLEGTFPRGESAWWESAIRDATTMEQRENLRSNQAKIERFAAMFRPHYYVSCWHMNNAENLRLWGEYTNGAPAVAIKTSLPKLRQALPDYIEIGVVNYIDYRTDRILEGRFNIFEFVMHKNAVPYAFEQELRAVTLQPVEANVDAHRHFMENFFQNEEKPFIRFLAPLIDFTTLLDAIVLHPKSCEQNKTDAFDLCADYGLTRPVNSVYER